MTTEDKLRRERRIGWMLSIPLIAIGALAYLTIKFVTPQHRVASGSMRPTIHQGDRVFLNRLAYLDAKPQAGEVAAFRDEEGKFIFRILAGPGDTIEMRDNVVSRNGKQVVEPYIMLTPDIPAVRSFGPVKVPPGQYFLLGDNRDNANDSRFRGFIAEDQILGRMSYVLHIGNCEE